MLKRVADQPPRQALRNYINFYLSASHRDSRRRLPAAVPGRRRAAPGRAVARTLRPRRGQADGILATHLTALDFPHPEDEASALAQLVGAVSLARAETDPSAPTPSSPARARN
jgi:TetR/AcrR family transcriptional repressor of nem operon